MARWPMPSWRVAGVVEAGRSAAGIGLVVMKWMRGSRSWVSKTFFWRPWEAEREVQVWPVAGTNWRGSCPGGSVLVCEGL
jgi:hypothetical protein